MDLGFNTLILARDARSYHDAYEVLQEKTRELHIIQSNKIQEHQEKAKGLSVPMPLTEHDMDLSSPALVCLAFSVELHIKLLLRTYDIIGWGHNIKKLLKKLPEAETVCISSHPDFHPTQQGKFFLRTLIQHLIYL